MFDENDGLRMISSARHALLNDIQLIKGYLYLNQPQKASAVIDRLTDSLRQHSLLSRLGMPKTVFYLINADWAALPFHLTVGIDAANLALRDSATSHCQDGKRKLTSVADEELSVFFRRLFEQLGGCTDDPDTCRVDVRLLAESGLPMACVAVTGECMRSSEARAAIAALYPCQHLICQEQFCEQGTSQNKGADLCLSIKSKSL
ncbi:MAG: Spo0B domain-containing protein [Sporolactobacillus sp.]